MDINEQTFNFFDNLYKVQRGKVEEENIEKEKELEEKEDWKFKQLNTQ